MKKFVSVLCGVLLFAVSLLVSCSHNVGGGGSYTVPAIDISYLFKHEFTPPKDSENTVFWEDFEGSSINEKNNWDFRNASLTTLSDIRSDLAGKQPQFISWVELLFNGADSQVIRIEDEILDTSYIKYDNLNITEDCYLTFRYFYVAVRESVFRVVLDGEDVVYSVKGSGTSAGFTIRTVSVEIPAGTTSISFEAENTNGYQFDTWPNAAFIDDITLVYDKISEIIVTPRSSQKTYIGCPDKEKIRVQAYAVRADGTMIDKEVSLSSSKGPIDNKGYFTPKLSGTFKISGICDGITGESGEITIAANNSCEGPCTVGGITYRGIQSDNGTSLSSQNKTYSNYNGRFDFDYPRTDKVTADGFVRIKGKYTPSTLANGELDRVLITVESGEKETVYICDRYFDLRVWLPFGREHKITVNPANINCFSYTEDGKVCEGDTRGWVYMSGVTITATNTNSNSNILTYPSWYCQADSFVVQNFTNEALYGLPQNASAERKFKAIHDYICLNFYYDYDSVISNNLHRKKQDAVSAIKNKTAVCEGYANLTAAMARYAGIPSGVVVSNRLNHAWNRVWINGTELFCDTTWDDPDDEPYSDYISYKYFLLSDFDGVNKDHEDANQHIDSRHAASGPVHTEELSELLKQGYLF